jgi:bla regulator protein BlaR1
VAIWFIVLSAHCIRLLANIGYMQRIRHYKTHNPSAYWKQKVSELAERLQIKKQVQLLESEIVKVPMIAGIFKPIILFPFSLLSQLPQDQVEAVLLHELAHIKRKDYLVNLLQSFGGIFFFFNPGVIWISSLIRDERENCCDDIAIGETKRKKEFIHALVSFQEYNMAGSVYTTAFPGRKNHLLNRVKRIITNNNKTLNNMEKISLSTGLVIISFIAIAFTQIKPQANLTIKETENNQVKPIVPPAAMPEISSVNDTLPVKTNKKGESRFDMRGKMDGKEIRIVEVNNQVTELYVDGERIPGEKIAEYQPLIEKMHAEAKQNQAKLKMQTLQLDKKKEDLQTQQERLNAEIDQFKKTQDDMVRENKKVMDLSNGEQFRLQQEALQAEIERLQKNQEAVIKDAKGQLDFNQRAELLKIQEAELIVEQKQLQLQREILQKQVLNINITPLQPISPVLMTLDITPVVPIPPVKENKSIKEIIDVLIDEKIISDRDNLSFTLNNEILKVNGTVQPEEIHSRLKKEYIKGVHDHIKYSTHDGSTSSESITNKN